MQRQIYWEAHFLNRCIERGMERMGLCNLPYETLADEKAILDTAYELYCKMENRNVPYNDTLDSEAASLVKKVIMSINRKYITVCIIYTKIKIAYIGIVSKGAVNYCIASIPEIFKVASQSFQRRSRL